MVDRLTGTQEMIPIANLIVDHRYQRPRKERQINQIAQNFDPDLFDGLKVSLRMEGVYAILDGQQRYWALLAMGWNDQLVPCIVHRGLSTEREAEIFEGVNEGRTAVNVYEDWKSRMSRGESAAMQITQVAKSAGMVLADNPGTKQPYEISAIATLETMWEHVGNDNLSRILRVLHEGFPEDVIIGPMIHGMAMFIMEYRDEIKDGLLISRLNKLTSEQLIRRAETLKNGHSGSRTMFIAYTLLDVYNHGQTAENRLHERTPSAFAVVLREWVMGERRQRTPGQRTNVRSQFVSKTETTEQIAKRMEHVRSFRGKRADRRAVRP